MPYAHAAPLGLMMVRKSFSIHLSPRWGCALAAPEYYFLVSYDPTHNSQKNRKYLKTQLETDRNCPNYSKD